MELPNYELIRYPSGQLVITRLVTAGGVAATGPRDVVGVYSSEQEAQSALDRLAGRGRQRPAEVHPAPTDLRG